MAETTDVPTVTVPLDKRATQSVVEIQCPDCGAGRRVEPDADYTVNCEVCDTKYKVTPGFGATL